MSSSSSGRTAAGGALSRVADESREEDDSRVAASRVAASRDDSREATGSRTGASRVGAASRGGVSRVARGDSRVVGSREEVAVSREVVVPRVGGGGSRDGGAVRVSRDVAFGGGTSEGRSAVRAAIESSEALFVGGGGALVRSGGGVRVGGRSSAEMETGGSEGP